MALRESDFDLVVPRPLGRGHGVIAGITVAIALVGGTLLVTGAAQVFHRNESAGIPVAAPGPIAVHEAAGPADLVTAHARTGHTTPATTPRHGSPGHPPAQPPVAAPVPAKPYAPAQGTQLPNTIRLPQGGTAYLVHGNVTADGTLPVPTSLNQAVWWGTGPTAPAGATVFAGHVNWAGSIGPFAELWHDSVGAIITIRDNSGNDRRYQVTQLLTVSKDDLPTQAATLFAPTGPPRLVLATCGGEWIGGDMGYNDNRIVIATPMPA
jgi:hypothetical protein